MPAMRVAGEAHVTHIGVAPMAAHGSAAVSEVVPESGTGGPAPDPGGPGLNDAAQALYHGFGFAPAGVRKNYYAE